MGNYFSSQPNLEGKVCKWCRCSSIPTVVERVRHSACLQALIKAGVVDKHKRKSVSGEALYTAANRGNAAFVKILVEAGADMNKKHLYDTPLVSAVKGGHEECVEFLLNKGADVNITERCRGTAVDVAARNGHEACLNLLIKAGADVNAAIDVTPLMKAVRYGHTKCVTSLIEAGADVSAKDPYSRAAFTYAVRKELIFPKGRVRFDTDELLLDFPRKCTYNQLQILMDAGADVNTTDKDGNTPLIIVSGSSVKCHIKCVKLFLSSGAKVNLFNNKKQNALCSHICKSKELNKSPDRTMVLLLYAAGETLDEITIDEEADNISCVLDYLDKREIYLKELCREAIRNHLLKLNLHQCLFNKIPQHGLPKLLSQYLLCNMSLDTNTE